MMRNKLYNREPWIPVRLRGVRQILVVLGVLPAISLLAAAGCVAPTFGGKLNTRQVNEIGAEASVQIESQYKPAFPTDAGMTAFQQAADTLSSHATNLPDGAKLRFAVMETGEQIAISLPDGHVYIGSGLLAAIANDPNEIACVLAHEAGHVALGHDRDNLSSILGESNVEDMLAQGKYADVVNTELELTRLTYTNQQEYQADRYAVQLATRCGYDASALERFLAAQAAQPHTQDGVYWGESHPLSKSRVGRIQQDIRSLRH